jgi:hypothetical protein
MTLDIIWSRLHYFHLTICKCYFPYHNRAIFILPSANVIFHTTTVFKYLCKIKVCSCQLACRHSTRCSWSNLNVSHSVSVAAAAERASCAPPPPPLSSSALPTTWAVHRASPTEVTVWNPSLFSSHRFLLHFFSFVFPFGSLSQLD